MPQRPFRFLHAADLHLERPAEGVTDAPGHLVDLLIDCPLRGAVRVFDAALDQRVDFVVLAGDVIDPRRCAPRELLFLVEQFDRLADRDIAVYWAGGPSETFDEGSGRHVWPSNVRLFPRGRVERLQHEIGGVPVCTIVGRGQDSAAPPLPHEFAPGNPGDDELFSIAVAHADGNGVALGEMGINYWALGGVHQRCTPLDAACVAHYAGSPQGRWADETGPHGCTLVEVDAQRHLHLTPLACDVVRWHTARLSLGATAQRHELEQFLREDTAEMLDDAAGVALLVTWNIACSGALLSALRHGSLAAELVSNLRMEFGRCSPPVWTIGIEAELPQQMPAAWLEEDSLRGDFLRAVRDASPGVVGDATDGLDASAEKLTALLASANLPVVVSLDDAESRRLLREVAWLGAELLSPGEAAR